MSSTFGSSFNTSWSGNSSELLNVLLSVLSRNNKFRVDIDQVFLFKHAFYKLRVSFNQNRTLFPPLVKEITVCKLAATSILGKSRQRMSWIGREIQISGGGGGVTTAGQMNGSFKRMRCVMIQSVQDQSFQFQMAVAQKLSLSDP